MTLSNTKEAFAKFPFDYGLIRGESRSLLFSFFCNKIFCKIMNEMEKLSQFENKSRKRCTEIIVVEKSNKETFKNENKSFQ